MSGQLNNLKSNNGINSKKTKEGDKHRNKN